MCKLLYIYIYIYIYLYVCMYVCMYVYIYKFDSYNGDGRFDPQMLECVNQLSYKTLDIQYISLKKRLLKNFNSLKF